MGQGDDPVLGLKDGEMNEGSEGRERGLWTQQGLNRTEGGRNDGRRETESLFQLPSPMSAIGRPGRDTLKDWTSKKKREGVVGAAFQGPCFPAICLSACMSLRYFISQHWVPATLEHLFLHPANQDAERQRKRRRKVKEGKEMWESSSDGLEQNLHLIYLAS